MARQEFTGLMTTMGKLHPDYNALSYKVKTTDVENWMQEVFDSITERIQKKNPKAQAPRVTVSLITLKASSRFAPFVLAMSRNVLQDSRRRNNGGSEKEYSQFDVKSDDPSVNLIKEFYTCISAWIYNKNDVQGITSTDGRHRMGISRNTSYLLQSIRTPKLMPFSGTEMVTVLIDPLRVFWMMLRDPENPDNKNFMVDIDSFKMISKSTAEFSLVRKKKSNKNKSDLNEVMAEAFNKKLRN